jgi:hypothetical protein
VRLVGEETDLEVLAAFFGEDPRVVKDPSGTWVLQATAVDEAESAVDALTVAQQALSQMNGAARLRYPDHVNVTHAGSVLDSEGGGAQVVAVGTVRVRLTIPDGSDQPAVAAAQSLWSGTATGSFALHAGHVLDVLGRGDPTWVDLAAILDTVCTDEFGTGKDHPRLAERAWADEDALRRFEATANNVSAAGLGGRHGHYGQKPLRPDMEMSMAEATTMVSIVVDLWLRKRLGQAGGPSTAKAATKP